MTIDFWGLALQAINVLILVWLLQRVFWRPVAEAIAKRQEAAKTLIDTATQTQAKANATLADVTQARDAIELEREQTLDAARQDAKTAAMATLEDARARAKDILDQAKATVQKDAATAHKENAQHASDLALKIAAKLLENLDRPAVQSAFLSQLLRAIREMPAPDRTALAAAPKGVKIVSATDLGEMRQEIETAITEALGGTPTLRFATDPDLIAGIELHSPHFVLRNSWQADLDQVRRVVKNAA